MNRNHRCLSFGLLVAALCAAGVALAEATPTPGSGLLAPDNHVLILIDHQPQMAFATKSIDIVEFRNNVTGLAKTAKVFAVPTILTTRAVDRLLIREDGLDLGEHRAREAFLCGSRHP